MHHVTDDEALKGGRYLAGTEGPLLEAVDGLLLDLDGVVYLGPVAVEHAPESIRAARDRGVRVVFVTNNANRLPGAVAEQLSALGIPAAGADVMTSAMAAAAMLQGRLPAGAPVLPVGGPGLRAALTDAGFRLVSSADDGPAAVVQGFAPTVGWADLAEAAYAIRGGSAFVATNLDLTIPTERGVAPGNGALVGVVRAATGVQPLSAGKPQPAIFEQAARTAGGSRPLVVGDRLDTDLAGAVAAGIPGLLVLTGVHDARAAVLARPAERPQFLALDLRGLAEPHPAPQRTSDGAWVCRDARVAVESGVARLQDGSGDVRAILLDEGAQDADDVVLSLDALRALCCAAWERRDAGENVVALPRLRVDDGDGARGR